MKIAKLKIENSNNGFTLIELMMVIAIIGILSAVVLTSVNKSRSKSRDAQRIANMREIRTSLELFYSQYGQYPITCSHLYWDGHWQCLATCLETGVGCGVTTTGFTPPISKVPQDPQDDPATLSDSDPTYYYGWPAGCGNGQSYRLVAYLENNNTVLQSDLDGSFYNDNSGCEDASYRYCVGVGTCSGW